MENLRSTLHRALVEQVRAAGLSPAELARATGYDATHVAKFLRGDRPLTFKFFDRLADALGVRVEVRLVPETHGEVRVRFCPREVT